jgi:hypothetical protein
MIWLVYKHNEVTHAYEKAAEVCHEERSNRTLRNGGFIYQTTRCHIPEDRDIHTNQWINTQRKQEKHKRIMRKSAK